jgi:tRNA threonylcarbamoyladenosine biosynthesis protein TsaE
MVILISSSPEETIALGASWGQSASPGLVIGLTGDLGAGKTQFVKGLAQGLGIKTTVTSPTFALLNRYDGGRLALFHLDLYRLAGAGEVRAAGLDDYLWQPAGVAVVEWMERWLPAQATGLEACPPLFRRVLIETLSETTRRITYEDSGS